MKSTADSFQALYDESHSAVFRMLARIAGPQDAADLVQVVFAKAAEALPKFRGESEVSTWLYRIAANVASDWLQSRPVREAKATVGLSHGLDAEADEAAKAAAISPEQELIRKEMHECIRRVVGQLPEKHRTVLMLAELAG